MKKLIIVVMFISAKIFAQNLPDQSDIYGLASPIQLDIDTTIINLEDYITDVNKISFIKQPPYFSSKVSADKKKLTLIRLTDEVPLLSSLKIIIGENEYTLLLRKSKKEKIHFVFDPKDSIYSKVYIVGDMSNWDPSRIALKLMNGIWQTDLILNPGNYQYQIVANGNWFLDPNNTNKIDNGIGGFNSLMKAGLKINSKLPFLSTYIVANDSVEIEMSTEGSVVALWQNTLLSDTKWKVNGNSFKEVFGCIVPDAAKKIKRSYIRIYGYNTYGEANDLLIPLEYGKVISNPAMLSKDDFQKTIMYFMMVDRFNDGDKSNDHPVADARVLPQANYYGGDITGIKNKIDTKYFQNMGFNALWISPIFQNPTIAYQEYPEPHRYFTGYHGYWPISLSHIDFRYGTHDEFKNLVSDAHSNNMTVYLDYVAHHVHEENPIWKNHPEWFTQLDLPNGKKNLRLWDEQRLTTWFEPYMPSFKTGDTTVANIMTDSAMYWLKEFNIDGFRHDATKHIDNVFWRTLTRKIKTQIEIPQQRNIYQIGETFGSRELINSYIGSGLLNAQFDFDLYFDARSVFALNDISFSRLNESLHESFNYFGWHHVMGNITGNQDMARFISYASGDLKFDENDKEVGWHRDIEVTDTIGYAKLKMLHAFNMTIPGIPIVYYGDEIGMPGANDPDNRRMMIFDSLNTYQQDVKNAVTKLANIRSNHMALLYGDFQEVLVNDSIYIYKRQYFNDVVYVCFNKSKTTQYQVLQFDKSLCKGPITSHFGSEINIDTKNFTGTIPQYKYIFTLKPYSFEIITFE